MVGTSKQSLTLVLFIKIKLNYKEKFLPDIFITPTCQTNN